MLDNLQDSESEDEVYVSMIIQYMILIIYRTPKVRTRFAVDKQFLFTTSLLLGTTEKFRSFGGVPFVFLAS
jgi:hypothetical protein